jgi:8-oxo-dGTP pyrophosphatase MutT (NUDIX family)
MKENYLFQETRRRLNSIYKMDVVMGIIINNKGELLLQKKTMDYKGFPGMWSLFGGEAESNDIEKEMERELEEEIGMELPIKFLFNFVHDGYTFHIFLSKFNDIDKISIGEGAGVAFFEKKEIEKLKIIPPCAQAIKTFLRSSD